MSSENESLSNSEVTTSINSSTTSGTTSNTCKSKTSSIWDFFAEKMIEKQKFAVCRNCPAVKYTMDKTCPTSNMQYHLKSVHPNEYEVFKSAKKLINSSKKKNASGTMGDFVQRTLPAFFQGFSQQRADSALAVVFATSEVSTNFVTDPFFQKFCSALQPKYVLPGRKALNNRIHAECQRLESAMRIELEKAKCISLCIDIWSKKDMSSYVGLTTHFYSSCSHKRIIFGLDLVPIIGRHTAENIKEVVNSVIEYWNIDASKIFKYVTDNGANIVKAFNSINELEETLMLTEQADQAEEADANVELEFDEEENEMFYQQYVSRSPCTVHTLQLVVRNVLRDEKFADLTKESLKIVATFNKSTMGTEELLKRAGKRLLSHCPTHWNTVYFVLERLLQLKTEVSDVCQLLSFDSLQPSQWKELLVLKDLLQPFTQFSEDLASAEKTTSSPVIPYIITLKEKMQKASSILDVTPIVDEINCRFNRFLQPNAISFDPFYAVSLILDPRFNALMLLPEHRSLKRAVIIEIERLFRKMASTNGNGSDSESLDVAVASEAPVAGSAADSTFDYLNQLLDHQEKVKAQRKTTTPISEEIEKLLKEPKLAMNNEPLNYWLSDSGSQFPKLQQIAPLVLCVPASTASVERFFSKCGLSCLGRRNRLSGKSLRNEVLMKGNYELFSSL